MLNEARNRSNLRMQRLVQGNNSKIKKKSGQLPHQGLDIAPITREETQDRLAPSTNERARFFSIYKSQAEA